MSTELQRPEVPQDGVSIMDVRYHLLGPIAPSAEMISEFRVASVSAAYSQMGDVAIITKSGANEAHGSAFWYHQNAAFDAEPYGSPQKQHKVFNTFGGSLGDQYRSREFTTVRTKHSSSLITKETTSRSRCWTSKRFFSALTLSGQFAPVLAAIKDLPTPWHSSVSSRGIQDHIEVAESETLTFKHPRTLRRHVNIFALGFGSSGNSARKSYENRNLQRQFNSAAPSVGA